MSINETRIEVPSKESMNRMVEATRPIATAEQQAEFDGVYKLVLEALEKTGGIINDEFKEAVGVENYNRYKEMRNSSLKLEIKSASQLGVQSKLGN